MDEIKIIPDAFIEKNIKCFMINKNIKTVDEAVKIIIERYFLIRPPNFDECQEKLEGKNDTNNN